MTPTRHLRSVGAGCSFRWVSSDARKEAAELLGRDPGAQAELTALLQRMLAGTLRRNRDYKQFQMIEGEPALFELTLDSAQPRLRLYFIEEGDEDGVRATGLALTEKPRGGTPREQRARQNEDAARAYGRRPM